MRKVVLLLLSFAIFSCKREGVKYYKNGNPKEIDTPEGNNRSVLKQFYENGTLKWEGHYLGKKRDGYFTGYYENGKKEFDFHCKNGKEEGVYKSYYDNGTIKKTGFYKDGIQDSTTKVFYRNGSIQIIENWDSGISQGEYKSFFANGKLKLSAIMDKDSTIYYEEFNENGELIQENRTFVLLAPQKIKLGETYSAKVKMSGSTKDIDVRIYTGYEYENTVVKEHFPVKAPMLNEFYFQVKPKKKGVYYWDLWVDVYRNNLKFENMNHYSFQVE